MTQPSLLQTRSYIDGLIEPQKVGLPSPGLNRFANLIRKTLVLQKPLDFGDEGLLFREIMDPADDLLVPILFGLVDRAADGENVNPRALALQLRHFSIAKRLAEGGKPLE